MKVLLINGHQRYEGFAEGKLNRTLVEAAKKQLLEAGHEVKSTVVDDGYDVAEELGKHGWADALFVQFPAYWMGVPYLFKKYIDEVYTAGIGEVLCRDDGRTRSDLSKKYGSGGLMTGKKYLLSSTWNAPLEAFEDPAQFFEGRGIDGALIGVHKIYQFFGMEPLPGFACHDVLKNADVDGDLERLRAHLGKVFPA